jgi:hypothetical protein
VTTSSRYASPFALPPAGTHPTGYAGFARAWDGAAWTGPVTADPDAPELLPRHPLLGMLRRPSLWCAVIGIALGFALWALATTLDSTPLLAASGLVACGGPLAAIVLAAHRRLRIGALHTPSATVWGVVAGLVALGVAIPIEWTTLGLPTWGTLALSGPIEEGAKLLVPFLLLLVGPRVFADPRLGVWTVIVSGAVFGVVEGVEWVSQVVLRPSHLAVLPLVDTSASVYDKALVLLLQRPWVELGHVIWTTGAAVIIWLAAHRLGRAFTWLALPGYLLAAFTHSFNDAVLGEVGAIGFVLSVAWMVVLYLFWYRASVRRLVPPDALGLVPKRWRPHLSKRMRANVG